MTGHTDPAGGRNPMDFDETMLKERFETAVGGISPDVARLVGAGSDLGAGMRRRRRSQGIGAAVASVAAVAAIAYVGIGQGLFDSDATGPADGSVSQAPTVPSTPRSLVAVALEHLPDDELVGAGTGGGTPVPSAVFVSLGLDTDRGKVQLDLIATTQVKAWDSQPGCAPGTPDGKVLDCQKATLPDGGKLVITVEKYDAGGSTGYVVYSGVRRADQVVGVIEHLPGTSFAPRDDTAPLTEWDLPVSVVTLRQIVTDPRFGVITSPEMIAAGEALEKFDEDGLVGSSSSSSGTSAESSVSVETVAPGQEPLPETPSAGEAPTAATKRPGETDSGTGQTDASAGP
jgi:hypothetical protein